MPKGQNNKKIDSQKLQTLLNEAINRAKEANDKSPILFIGNKGTGKSTTINLLAGCTMRSVIQGSQYRLETDGKPIAEEGHNTIIAKTLYPQIVSYESLTFADCPGFGDNREIEKRLCAAQGVQKVIEASESIQGLVITIDYPSLQATRSQGFMDVVDTVAELLKPIDQLNESAKKAVSFLITKVPIFITHAGVIADIKKIKTDLKEIIDQGMSEDQQQLDLLIMLENSKLFMLSQDGKGYDSNTGKELTLEENRIHMLQHFRNLPSNSITKNDFMLLDDKSELMKEIRQETAKISLYKLSQLDEKALYSVFHNHDNNIHEPFIIMQNNIKAIAKQYLNMLNGKNEDARSYEDFKLTSKALIKNLIKSFSSLSNTMLECVIDTLKKIRELHEAIRILFEDKDIDRSIAEIIENFIFFQNAMHHHLSFDSLVHCHQDKTELNEILHKVQKDILTLEQELRNLDASKQKIDNNYTVSTAELTKNIECYESELQRLLVQGEPALAPHPGDVPNVPPHPGNSPSDPGPEPHVRPHPGEQPIPPHNLPNLGNFEKGAFNMVLKYWQDKLNEHNADRQHHDVWQNNYNAYQAYHASLAGHNHAVAAHQQWRNNSDTYNNSLTLRNQYAEKLKTAQTNTADARAKLAEFEVITQQELHELAEKQTFKLITLKSAEKLRLFLLGSQQALASLQQGPHRESAIAIYQIFIDNFKSYQKENNDTLFASVLNKLQSTLDKLIKEATEINILYKDAVLVSNDSFHVEIKDNESIDNLLFSLKSDTQYLAIHHQLTNEEINKFCQKLTLCSDLITLNLSGTKFGGYQLAKLFLILNDLPKLTCLDLSDNDLDDDTGIALLAYIYSHPAIIDVKLDDNNQLSPVIINMINGILALRLHLDYDDSKKLKEQLNSYLQNYLLDYELLLLKDDKHEEQVFNVEVLEHGEFKINLNVETEKLTFFHYFHELQKMISKLGLEVANLNIIGTFSASVSSSYLNNQASFFNTKKQATNHGCDNDVDTSDMGYDFCSTSHRY